MSIEIPKKRPNTVPIRRRAPGNRSVALTYDELIRYKKCLMTLASPVAREALVDRTICQDSSHALPFLPERSVDLLFADPPYNLTKSFNERRFHGASLDAYERWLDSWLAKTLRVLKPTATVYICGDWRSSAAIQRVGAKYFHTRNRITWEREKGRGTRVNWKNCSEDIWFFTVSETYTFNVTDVMLKRRVLAPYRQGGVPKNWDEGDDGRFRLTHPSNLWTDLSVPFWSMQENTEHPTQKPEKLLAKIILASSVEGDLVLDPFAGSGTTAVVAKKLGRRYIGIEIDERYCCLAEKRLEMAVDHTGIQGYADGVFWERNSLQQQRRKIEGRNGTMKDEPLKKKRAKTSL